MSTIATVIALLSLFGAPARGTAQPGGLFYDDDSTVHGPAIEAIADAGITLGCNPPLNTRFCPSETVSRGQMAAFLSRALGLPDAAPNGFTDTASTVFFVHIDRLAAAGITKGCNPPDNDRYCPDEPVTRGQMAAFLARALELGPSSTDHFVDDEGLVFAPAINALADAGITEGCNPPGNDRYCPIEPVRRAEMASFLARALDLPTQAIAPRPYVIDAITRAEWGAEEPRSGLVDHQIDQLTIHHSDDGVSNSGPTLYRIWQDWHQFLGWPDLAYHFIIGTDGRVYEGRAHWARGDTATEYDTTGHLLIVLEGDFDDSEPTAAQIESLAQMVAWASMYFDIPTITGHRDHAATSCPGDYLYAHIADGSLAARAEAIIAEGGVTLLLNSIP